MAISAVPEGFHAVTPYLTVAGAEEAILFYQKAFGAVERYRLPMPNGRIGHAEIQIGDSIVMLADACPDWGNTDPKSLKGTPVALCLYVPDVDAVMARAVEAGATVLTPIKDQFYGDRNCSLIDPFGHRWTIATHKEDVSPEEMRRRMEGMFTTA